MPALPLTASSGYLFGLIPGFLTVLVSATIAASISFLIGRTLLRDWAQKIASGTVNNYTEKGVMNRIILKNVL